MADLEWRLPEIAKVLKEPQHRLIYLCEKGVVVPDLGEARGRGSSRRFSKRNLLEFQLALRLRRLALPVGVVQAITHILRRFAETTRAADPSFDIVDSLRRPGAVDLRILVKDGDRLYFSMARGGKKPRLFGGVDFQKLVRSKGDAPAIGAEVSPSANESVGSFGGPEGSRQARIEVSVTEIARSLELGK